MSLDRRGPEDEKLEKVREGNDADDFIVVIGDDESMNLVPSDALRHHGNRLVSLAGDDPVEHRRPINVRFKRP